MDSSEFARLINEPCMNEFGESYTLTRSEDLKDVSPATEAITAIPCNLPEQETNAPGDGSIYLFLWVNAAGFLDPPECGDEVTTDTTVYKIVDKKSDGAGGLYLKCRYDRDA